MQSVDEKKKKGSFGLGRGLDSLIPVGDDSDNNSPKTVSESEISTNLIDPNPHQPRTGFDETPLAELAASIREYGIIQPLLITRAENGRFQLVAGERRLRAAKLAGLEKVPVIIRTLDEQKKLEIAIIENVQRENLSPIEASLSYKRLMEEFELTQDEVSQKVGKARSTVANALRLLTLPAEIKQGLIEGKITEGHARSIMAISDREAQISFYHRIISDGLNVRQSELHVKNKSATKTRKDPNIKAAEKRLSEIMGSKVTVKTSGTGGKIIIDFFDVDELDRIYRKILGK
jgi:ParB family transcriptional regulator, chromosome partitioning protein